MDFDTQKMTQIGYETEASKKLPFPVKLLGITENEGQPVYHYVARIGEHEHHLAGHHAIQDLNAKGAYKNAGFGEAGLPTSMFHSNADELFMLGDRKELLGIEDQWIYGEQCEYRTLAYFLDCSRSLKCRLAAGYPAATYATWRMDRPVQ